MFQLQNQLKTTKKLQENLLSHAPPITEKAVCLTVLRLRDNNSIQIMVRMEHRWKHTDSIKQKNSGQHL